ncbi:uncharacterized protein LOC142665754 [Rhinoderma darwinii]|uniref:uncharacterized protein LOC142665754 n=1 Tax=Rhinoderma darwinii TaxID=43563 RepID=UPI003F66BDB5
MDKDRNEMSRRILDFTLEIIYLLSGEEYTLVKKTSGDCTTPIIHESGGWSSSPITEPPPHSRIHEKKILELIYKMTELLTGEVPIRCQDITVYFSMEEWEYLEGHKDLYEEVMMEDYRPRTSHGPVCHNRNYSSLNSSIFIAALGRRQSSAVDGSSRRNTPGRCPSPLYSQDSPEENHNVPENHQGENLVDVKVEVKDEAEEEMDVVADQLYGSSRRNPPERCPSPLYSQDCPEENHNVPENHQGEDLTNNKAENETEEERVRGDQPCNSKVEEEIPGGVTTENSSMNSEGNFMFSLNYEVEDEDIMQHSTGANLITLNVHPELRSKILSFNSTNHGENSPDQSQIVTTSTGREEVNRSQCDTPFTKCSGHFTHRRIHTEEKSYSCAECGKCFARKTSLVTHERSHKGEKPYSCSECGKCFTNKSHLVRHEKSHTGKAPYSCSECGKCFTDKSNLVMHKRSHTGEKPYSCSECWKCFTQKSGLVRHQRSHTKKSLFSVQNVGNVSLLKTNFRIIRETT